MTVSEELQRAALAMTEVARAGGSVRTCLRAVCPDVYRQIRRDARFPELFMLWGRCVNFDDNARRIIVEPAILRAIGTLAHVPVRGRVVHAGLQHTYGYLFSTIETPYGFKRDRWVSTDLERGLGIHRSLLGGRPRDGTLLANVTWVLGQLAFRGRRAELGWLERQAAAVAPALRAYDYAALAVRRIVETVRASREVTIVTDLVSLPHAAGGDRLLIYSTAAGPRAPLRLVTAFPVTPATAEELLDSAKPGRVVDVRLRYNAYVRGLHGRTVPGSRVLVHPRPV